MRRLVTLAFGFVAVSLACLVAATRCGPRLGRPHHWMTHLSALVVLLPTCCSAVPIVSSFTPLNAHVSGAYTVTVLGLSFESSDMTPSAYVSGQPCATTTWTAGTQLVCAAPAPVLAGGVGREAWVKVLSDTASRGFSFDGTDACVQTRLVYTTACMQRRSCQHSWIRPMPR